MRRFFGYGLAGWGLEVLFTSIGDGLWMRDRRLRGHSYLWMLPIYGAGGLAIEALHARLEERGVPRWGRSLAYMFAIYGLEFGAAASLNFAIGDVPWRYRRGLNLRGYVRLDYAPFWYAAGWFFEGLQRELRKLDRPARKMHRPRARPATAPISRPATAPVSDVAASGLQHRPLEAPFPPEARSRAP